MTPALLVAFAVVLVGWVLRPIIVARPLPSAPTGDAAPRCPRCGPRPEADARSCSECGSRTSGAPAT